MDPTHASPPEYGEEAPQRRRLINRIALAALAIAALLAGLAVTNRYYMAPPPTPPRTVSALLTPSPSPAVPDSASSPGSTQPVPESITEATKTSEPGKPVAGGVIRPASPAETPAEDDRPASRIAAHHALPPKPLVQGRDASGQVVLQMGVFNDVANAQSLNEKLKRAGVPSRIEARVQVGPFKTRRQAEDARRKLVALGMSPGALAHVRK
jgi:DedD protein